MAPEMRHSRRDAPISTIKQTKSVSRVTRCGVLPQNVTKKDKFEKVNYEVGNRQINEPTGYSRTRRERRNYFVETMLQKPIQNRITKPTTTNYSISGSYKPK